VICVSSVCAAVLFISSIYHMCLLLWYQDASVSERVMPGMDMSRST
jgi:hypothetical protein